MRLARFCARAAQCVRRADISGDVFSFSKWQVMDRIDLTDNGPHRHGPSPLGLASILCLSHLSFRYLSTPVPFFCSLYSQVSFSLGWAQFDKSDAKFRDVFLKVTGARKRKRTTDKMASAIPVYYLLFISFKECEVIAEKSLFNVSLRKPSFLSVVQLNISGHILQRTGSDISH